MTHDLGFLLTALQGSVGGIDMQREGRVGQRVFVAATHKRFARQGGQALQRVEHLGSGTFEHPPTA